MSMFNEKKKILILVKTYPNPSHKYQETVCTAGITDDGKWIRLYPVTYRELDEGQQYNKYDWIEVKVKKSNDQRTESYRPDESSIKILGHMGTENGWQERKAILYQHASKSLDELVRLRDSYNISLGMFKPRRIISFSWEKEDSSWSPAQEAPSLMGGAPI